jgi:hypothetical protein
MASVNVLLREHTFGLYIFDVVVVEALLVLCVSAEAGLPLKHDCEEFISLLVLALANQSNCFHVCQFRVCV